MIAIKLLTFSTLIFYFEFYVYKLAATTFFFSKDSQRKHVRVCKPSDFSYRFLDTILPVVGNV